MTALIDFFSRNPSLGETAMKKFAALMAGVAAIATAGAASADTINKGQWTNNFEVLGVVVPGLTRDVPGFLGGTSAANIARALDGGADVSAWHAVGASLGDVGNVGNDGASFTLQGEVSRDCVYYSGNNNTETFDFGTLGIYAGDETGPAAAFTMVAPAVLAIQTNLAGCNTNNRVTLSRTVADMTNASTSGFDNTVFTNSLPYEVTAVYAGATQTAGGGSSVARNLKLATGDLTEDETNGAWKSPMTLAVVIPQQTQALLAGNYEGTFTLTIAAE
ncbi:hypothetical protein [Brevundimonas sp. UBA7534]|uniref:hypothetical protein n=1 Tax=Brevundimonas sp. UBA7534 TaxID=1946138 RepID=UPI0025BBA359|nr:hypothetical protein [Brevundimonas sp. UBA7534]